ncbi:MAG: hypothetical protein SFU86_00440 [Pirellulaceae bacterium]|nr:hypothetical protein [Pirellulaceae bacterium]
MSEQEPRIDSISCLILRVFWILAGNMILILLGLSIVVHSPPLPSLTDFAYGGVVVLMIAARFLDLSYFQGNPAGAHHDWRRHALLLVAIASLAWAAARLVARVAST